MSKNITVIGAGYVGLVTALCLAEIGHNVIVIEQDKEKISKLENGDPIIYEPQLKELLKKHLKAKNIFFTNSYAQALKNRKICILAVGTPYDELTQKSDLTFVDKALSDVLHNISDDILIVNKSTVPLNTAQNMQNIIDKHEPKYRVSVASNPEFLSQGRAVKDFMNPRRIVVGTGSKADEDLLIELYKPFIDQGYPFVATDIASSELIKYAANSFLALKVAYINEIAELAANYSANINDISLALGLDERIGDRFLSPGPGYGGSCFPKDSRALKLSAQEANLDLPIINNIDNSNELTIKNMANKISQIIDKYNVNNILFLGVAFKAGTDDIRDSQTVKIVNLINSKNRNIVVNDPYALAKLPADFKGKKEANLSKALKGAELICVMTEWAEFLDISDASFKNKIIIDLRNLFKKFRGKASYYELGVNFK
ncbi:MAG: UDP-glucose/GDP-mannose dehydrogenase family protein [Alphaproteobacteria bacterium]|jgi:UDPglucose 6-dehydrogenase|nr:UDP-glucose/GDP-mannose dehydrogenase family protein [Alphaproteobacteria bacterium]